MASRAWSPEAVLALHSLPECQSVLREEARRRPPWTLEALGVTGERTQVERQCSGCGLQPQALLALRAGPVLVFGSHATSAA